MVIATLGRRPADRAHAGRSTPMASGRQLVGHPEEGAWHPRLWSATLARRGMMTLVNRRALVDLTLSQAAPLVGSFLVTFGSAVALGPTGRGELAFITSSCTVAGTFLFASLHVGATRAQTTGTAGLRAGTWLAVIILSTASVVALIAASLAPVGLGGLGRLGYVGVVVGAVLVAVNLYVLRTVQGLGQHRAFRNAWAIQSLVYLVLGLPAAIATQLPILVVLSWFIALLLSTGYAARTYAALMRQGPARAADRGELLRSSLLAHVGLVGNQLLYRADVVILGILTTAREVGIYSVATAVAGLVWIVAEAFGLAAFSRGGGETDAELDARDRRLIATNLVLSVVGALAIAVLSVTLIGRWLPQFADAVPLILILLPGIVAQGPSRVAFSSLLRRKDVRQPMWIGVVSFGLAVTYVPCAVTWGGLGVAMASSVVYLVQAGFVLALWRRASASPSGPSRPAQEPGCADGTETALA